MSQKTKNQIAKCTTTGLYFNGIAFEENDRSKATRFSPETTSADFKLFGWEAPVEMETINEKPSYAMRIHTGEFNKYGAAAAFIRENGGVNKNGKSNLSFSIRIAGGKYISRKITVPKSSRPGECEPWISLYNNQCAVAWSKGELATDFAD